MTVVAGAFATVAFWYVAAVVMSFIMGFGLLAQGSAEGLAWLLFGAACIGSIVAGAWLAWRNASWDLAWLLLPLAASVGLAAAGSYLAGPTWPPSPSPMSERGILAVKLAGVAVQLGALAVMTWRLWPDWRAGGAFATFCLTVFAVAYWSAGAAMTHMYL